MSYRSPSWCVRRVRPQVEECEPRWAPAAGFEVTPTTGLTTTETGDQATFTVRLTEAPTDNVVVSVVSSNEAEGAPDVASLVFTASDWDIPQTVTVTGADDFVDDGDVSYQIILDAAVSNDANYDGLDPADVEVVNQDDDVAGIALTRPSGMVTNEGVQGFIGVRLTSAPTETVTVPIAAVGKFRAEVKVAPAQLVFTPDNWDVPQNVRVLAKADTAFNEPKEIVQIRIGGALSSDLVYAGRVVNTTVTVRDLGIKAFNGVFNGTFNATTPVPGAGLVSGALSVKVAGGKVTVTKPGSGTGSITITNSAKGTFKYSVTLHGVKITGTGTIKILPSGLCTASGSWTGGGGAGKWQLSRV